MISAALGNGGDHGCLGADARLGLFFVGPSRSLVSPVLALDGASIFAAACCEDSVGDTGDPRRGWCAGMPRADAKLLAIEEDSRLGTRALPGSLGGWPWPSWPPAVVFVFPPSVADCVV